MQLSKWICVVVVLAGLCASAQTNSARGPSTTEERARAVEVAHKLEVAPLDESLRGDREWLLLWLIQVPDIHVKICTNVLGDFMKAKYKHSSEIVGQLTFSAAAFVIEHPDQASSDLAQYQAGVEGVLKAYQAILKVKPKDRSKALDELLQLQSDGKLADSIKEASKTCK
jgi:hypothetical protein